MKLPTIEELKAKSRECIDKLVLRVPAEFISELNSVLYHDRDYGISFLKWHEDYGHVVFHDDVFDNDLRIWEAICLSIQNNLLEENSLFPIDFNFSELYDQAVVYELEIAFNFPNRLFLFNFDPFNSTIELKYYGRRKISLYSKGYTKAKKDSFFKFYDRYQKLKAKGIECEPGTMRCELLLDKRALSKLTAKDLDVSYDKLKGKLNPIFVKNIKKYLKHENFYITDTALFNALHPYLYKILRSGGCGRHKSKPLYRRESDKR